MVPLCKTFKRSCDPNVDWTHVDSKVGYFACKPIKQGKPILLSKSQDVRQYYITSKTARHLEIGYATDNPVPCECTPCIQNWPVIDYLPSHRDMMRMTEVVREYDCMMLKLEEWQFVIEHGDTENLLTIKSALNKIDDKIHQYIDGPCRETAYIILSLKSLYRRLLTVLDPHQ